MVNQVRVIISDLTRFTEKVVTKLSLDITSNLQSAPSEGGTPVDSGWARASWFPTIGAPVGSPSDPGGVPTAAAVSAKFSESQTAITSLLVTYRLPMGAVFVSNGVPYIQKLNDGWSKQAPKGFIEKAIQRGVATSRVRRGII